MRAEFIRRYPISGRLSFRRFHDTNPCSRRIPADLKTSILRRQSWVTASKHQNLVECHCETGLPPWLQGLKKKGPRLRALGHSLTKSCAEQVAHRKWLQVMLRTTSETWAKRTGSREVSAHELRLKAGSSSGNTISLPVQQQQQQPQQPILPCFPILKISCIQQWQEGCDGLVQVPPGPFDGSMSICESNHYPVG